MTSRFLLYFLFFLISGELSAITISGENPEYPEYSIVFYKQADPFTGNDQAIAECVSDSNGFFSFNLSLKETTYIYSYFGVYKMFLFAEPGKNYKVVLPARQDKTKEDEFNPFFEYTEAQIGLVDQDKNDLNLLIRMFDDGYYPYYKKHTEQVFSDNLDFEQLDKDIEEFDKPFSKSKNEYFNSYRKYKYGLLRFVAYQHKSKNISDMYFKNQPFLINNPAYIELFNKVYEGYFDYFSRTEDGMKLGSAIRDQSYFEVKNVLATDNVLQPVELLNMVLLHSFYEEFYDDNYSRTAMLSIIDSLIEISNNDAEIITARSIRQEVIKLLPGYAPPSFKLYDVDSNLVSLDDFKGKFVYLNFCSCFSYTCLNEFIMLQNLYNKHSKYLSIVTIVIDDDVQVMKDFVERSGYSWTFLHFDNQPTIFQEYDVRAFPTYFLIDDEGKLNMSPAPSPAEQFEGRLFKALRAKGIL